MAAYGPRVWARIPSLEGSDVGAPVLEAVYNGAKMGLL